MRLDTIYEVGSFMGCSCGLSFGDFSRDDPSEHHEKRLANVRELQDFLRTHASQIVRIMTLEDYDRNSLDEFERESLDLNQMATADEFSFDPECIYEIATGK